MHFPILGGVNFAAAGKSSFRTLFASFRSNKSMGVDSELVHQNMPGKDNAAKVHIYIYISGCLFKRWKFSIIAYSSISGMTVRKIYIRKYILCNGSGCIFPSSINWLL